MQVIEKLTSTRIYLSTTQMSRLEALSLQLAVSKNELVQCAIDQFLEKNTPPSSFAKKAQRLNGIMGIWATRAETINPVDFVANLRISRF
jgi:hypothetical protein